MTKRSPIDEYQRELDLRQEGRGDERVFIESRLRFGVYGQRYDDGLRFDGKKRRSIVYAKRFDKGLGAAWDAPGMQRIKLPWGGMTPAQMEVMAELAEEYADGILHVTTRQDVQLHFVRIDDTPELLRRLAAAEITTREACGNSVRNVTACALAGVCNTEIFDVTPYAEALARFFLGHPDVQAFGRKFKISFSGCREEACGLVRMHDLGFIAKLGAFEQRGFEVWVGGGLGAVPFEAKLLFDFVSDAELLPMAQAIARVFAEHGEKKNRARARMKFLVEKIGIDELKKLVLEARAALPPDPRFLEVAAIGREEEVKKPVTTLLRLKKKRTPSFELWAESNVRPQKQIGFVVATVTLPLGDLTAEQMRGMAEIARRYASGPVRATVDQNLLLRFVKEIEVRTLYEDLRAIGLAEPGAGTIADVTACPGTDTCRLGISSSRGLAAELRTTMSRRSWSMDQAVRKLRIKVSGCYNSCAQQQLADIGFYGMSRKKGDRLVPHFQVVLGGRSADNGAAYGLAIGAVPAKNIPRVVDRLATRFVRERGEEETFTKLIERLGRKEMKAMLADLMVVPEYYEDPSFYSDFGDPREFTLDDHRAGEGAGQAISLLEIGLAASEREVFEAQLVLEKGDAYEAGLLARAAMFTAARALVRTEIKDIPTDEEVILAEFRLRFIDRNRIGDHARFLYKKNFIARGLDDAKRRINEAQLFIEAAHAVEVRS